jgi:hypothetical protein
VTRVDQGQSATRDARGQEFGVDERNDPVAHTGEDQDRRPEFGQQLRQRRQLVRVATGVARRLKEAVARVGLELVLADGVREFVAGDRV